MDKLIIKGARQHNLKNINLELPKNKLIVFTGLSGSGKSSLAFDTIYAEGQRRYVESLSSYARQFLGIMDKPDVDSIDGLSPAISIDQKSASHNPRSTVGTVTEIYDYLRLLFARIGHPHCPICGREVSRMSKQEIVTQVLKLASKSLSESRAKLFRFFILSPVVRDRKGEFTGLFENLKAKGFRTVRIDGHFFDLDEDILLIKTNKHTIDVVIDKISVDLQTVKFLMVSNGVVPTVHSRSDPKITRINDSVEQALALSDGLVFIGEINDAEFTIPDKPTKITDHIFSERFACPIDNIVIPEIEPRTFSFNSPHGACPTCTGLGTILTVDPDLVINPILSISEGGILPFAKMFLHDTWYARVISKVCRDSHIDMRAPLSKLTSKQKQVLLYGTGDELHLVRGQNRFGDSTTIEEIYRGIIPELKRRFTETDSDFVRLEIQKYMREETCENCHGKRLKPEALTITIDGLSIAEVTDLSVTDIESWTHGLMDKFKSERDRVIAKPIIKEISARLGFLLSVGLEYLTLSRTATTLSGGEAQRIRLASQIGSGLSGVLYVLDEPSIGLHQKDNKKLIDTLKKLRDLGNTVIVVEHDRETMLNADWLVDFGPGAGEHGGAVVSEGSIDKVLADKHSLTSEYLRGDREITKQNYQNTQKTPNFRRSEYQTLRDSEYSEFSELTIKGASQNNLKNLTVKFPLGKFICVTGVSGSGKSSLVVETLYPALVNKLYPYSKEKQGIFESLEGTEAVDKVILIDQSPIGRTPRSNPATYTGSFSLIRDLFSTLPDARLRGYKTGRFSFNVKGGRCEACEGEGRKKIEMQFLSDVYVTCEVCHGTRYNQETLEVLYHGKNIAAVLEMTVDEALSFFSHIPGLVQKLQTIVDVGLGYIHLGQPAPTLSGGEAQRVKLASELSRRSTGRTVYILDEPTTGLHFADLEKLLHVLDRLTALGNTVIVIEHNLDLIKNTDWIIDLGPDGGDAGGKLVAVGTPGDLSRNKNSYTGHFLKDSTP